MKILGIETSCDETAAAVVENGTRVLSNVIASQVPLHRLTGGVVPEVAAREHVLKIIPVIEQALMDADGARLLHDIDAIAVTRGPGLLSSLVIGTSAASALAMALSKPLIAVNHIAGHIYANWLGESPQDPLQFPIVVLTVSGGHNELVLMRDHMSFEILGETLDDAAGEAFDKVARLLGLGYPGGPEIARAAEGPRAHAGARAAEGPGAHAGVGGRAGDRQRFSLPKAYLSERSFDFSFSGLKTAVLKLVREEFQRSGGRLSPQFIADCAASFQEAVCEVLSDKLLRAAKEYGAAEMHLAGGVSANKRLREMVSAKTADGYFFNAKPKLRYPQNLSYCTDNAAMIAGAAYFQFQTQSRRTALPILADPNLALC